MSKLPPNLPPGFHKKINPNRPGQNRNLPNLGQKPGGIPNPPPLPKISSQPTGRFIESFDKMPSESEWKKRSSVGSHLGPPYRRNDPVLVRIDNLVSSFPRAKDPGEKQYLLCELFFATMYWNNHYQTDKRMEHGRRPAVMSLLLCAQRELSKMLQCSVGQLGTKLAQLFGKSMDTHGYYVDAPAAAHYLSEAVREKFRVFIADRKIYRLDWRGGGPPLLLDTAQYFQSVNKQEGLKENWSFFVMSNSREIYVAPHQTTSSHYIPKAHSSYLSGRTVQCAGSLKVEQGVITGLMNDSGHYKPADPAMVNVLELLKTAGIDISRINVHTMPRILAGKQETVTKGDIFLKANGNWDAILGRSKTSMWQDFSSGKVTLRQLVEDHFERERTALISNKQIVDEARLWSASYKAVCMELGQFDPTWKIKAGHPPIPRQRVKRV